MVRDSGAVQLMAPCGGRDPSSDKLRTVRIQTAIAQTHRVASLAAHVGAEIGYGGPWRVGVYVTGLAQVAPVETLDSAQDDVDPRFVFADAEYMQHTYALHLDTSTDGLTELAKNLWSRLLRGLSLSKRRDRYCDPAGS